MVIFIINIVVTITVIILVIIIIIVSIIIIIIIIIITNYQHLLSNAKWILRSPLNAEYTSEHDGYRWPFLRLMAAKWQFAPVVFVEGVRFEMLWQVSDTTLVCTEALRHVTRTATTKDNTCINTITYTRIRIAVQSSWHA